MDGQEEAKTVDTTTKEFLNFPDTKFLESLIFSFPQEWRGIFGVLNQSVLYAVAEANDWVKERCSVCSQRNAETPPHWRTLLTSLASNYPVVLGNEMFLKPRIFCLPLRVRNNLLSLLCLKYDSLPREETCVLVDKLESTCTIQMDEWCRILILQLKEKMTKKFTLLQSCQLKSSNRGGTEKLEASYIDFISESSRSRFENLCERIRDKKCVANVSESKTELLNHLQFEPVRFETSNDQKVLESKRSTSNKVNCTDFGCKDFKIDMESGLQLHQVSDTISFNADRDEVIIIPDSPETSDVFETHTEDYESAVKKMKFDESFEIVPSPPKENNIQETNTIDKEMETDTRSKLTEVLLENAAILKRLIHSNTDDLDLACQQEMLQKMEFFSSCNSSEVIQICEFLDIRNIPEATVVLLCKNFTLIPMEPGYNNTLIFVKNCLLPHMKSLVQVSSRNLLTAVCIFAKKFPKAFIDGVVIEICYCGKLGPSQADLISKTSKESFTTEFKTHLLERILNLQQITDETKFIWTDDVLSFIQPFVDAKLELMPHVITALVTRLDEHALVLCSSLKYAKFVLAVINKYSSSLVKYIHVFQHIAECNSTFLKKSILSSLKKLN